MELPNQEADASDALRPQPELGDELTPFTFECDSYLDFFDTLKRNPTGFDWALPFFRSRISIAGSGQVT